jgi:phage terminase small subunit
MNNSENLTLQQQRFCDEYLVSFNAYSAAVCAGYSMNTARKAELLHLPKIQAYLKAGMAKNAERLQVSHDMILRELAKIAFSNMGNYYDDNATLKPMCLLTTDEKAAISQYQIMDSLDQDGNRVGELSRIKLHNKMSALDKIARHVGFYAGEVKGERLKEKGFAEQEAGSLKQEAFEGEQEAGSLKHEAFFETQESGNNNKDEDGLVMNGDGELVADLEEVTAADGELVCENLLNGACTTRETLAVAMMEDGDGGVEKILTLSPLAEWNDQRARNREERFMLL